MVDLIIDSLMLVYDGCDPKEIDFFTFAVQLKLNPYESVKYQTNTTKCPDLSKALLALEYLNAFQMVDKE